VKIHNSTLTKNLYREPSPREEKGEGKLNSNNSYTHLTAVDRSKVGPSLIINNITKKSSINLYIKSSLQRMLHKKIVMNSIVKTWQNIYKKAYLKAMYKTLSYFFNAPKNGRDNPTYNVKQFESILSLL